MQETKAARKNGSSQLHSRQENKNNNNNKNDNNVTKGALKESPYQIYFSCSHFSFL